MKIILVDDERIATEHMKSLLDWEAHGFHIAATATNGRSALKLCEDLRPQIMIVDIRMPVMDGLELIHAATERKLGVKFIVMSAYEDFEYARKAISLGSVSSYLIKHEVNSDKLLLEVNKAKDSWETEEAQRVIQRSEQLKALVTRTAGATLASSSNLPNGTPPLLKPPYAMAVFHSDTPFSAVPAAVAVAAAPLPRLTWEQKLTGSAEDSGWLLVGAFPLNADQSLALFSLKSAIAAPMRESFHALLQAIREQLSQTCPASFSICYTCEADERAVTSLPASYHKITAALHHAVFIGPQATVCADDLPLPQLLPSAQQDISFAHSSSSARLQEVAELLSQHANGSAQIESVVTKLFTPLCQPVWNLRGLYHTARGLTALINEHRVKRGLLEIDPFDTEAYHAVYSTRDIQARFVCLLRELCTALDEARSISHKLQKAILFIHAHYREDISIDAVADAVEISASYLFQLFKRELGRTFLDYLTEHRIHHAKRILRHGDTKMTEVATLVGYRSPQHFSQVFKKLTGTLPHQYRSGDYSR
ncbi:helix-turn-helix domain-containing protein [Paenibacillus sp. OV219]|uniref:helix-turn-helix domain-containing protein n=1 Tax=Paenibacillus sp. OV219 TaxID=1884377 RepID=UPI0008C4479E|nr:helix-turn-helix domain-containing protein [Paenibacillus sp. OV219]SEO31942.1 two-component system, response regulator YesN [Paenibacillus sp. OV219]